MSEKQSIWSAVGAVLGGVAAIVTAITGLYLAFRHEPSPIVSANVTGVSAGDGIIPQVAAETGAAYERTPWLGIELRQNDRPVRLHSVGDAWDRFAATLDTGEFQLVVSRRTDDPSIGILAWHDESIFECVRGGELHLPGTGIAGAQFAVPILYLNKEGFNYYDTDRMKRIDDNTYSIFISTIGSGELELPLPRFSGPLYLIDFRVPSDMTVRRNDFELITLRRQ